ncbi:MAG: AI-2E family transporter [Bacteroidota bacterium]|nr:AI-2E family transporter [Bacteroidota bacterium]
MAKENGFSFSSVVKWIVGLATVGLVLFSLWYFKFIVVCIFLAIIFSLVGRPVMSFLEKIKIGKRFLSKSLCAGLTLILELGIISLVVYLLVPLIVSQAMNFADIDMQKVSQYYSVHIKNIEQAINQYNLLPENLSLETFISGKIMAILNSFKLPSLANNILSLASNLVMGVMVTMFITFFFLKDSHIVMRFIDNITPDKYILEVHNIIKNTRLLISRYFLGVFCEILIMITLLSIGFYIAGFNNVFLIAGVCGIMVILPYIGVLIGGGLGLMILVTGFLAQNPNGDIFPIVAVFVLIFVIVKLIDDFLLQPFIYSKSVKAQPLEIFLIILMAGRIGGIWGMVLAIPVYTFLRIIAKEFFSKWKFIKALTKEIG